MGGKKLKVKGKSQRLKKFFNEKLMARFIIEISKWLRLVESRSDLLACNGLRA